MRDVAFFGCMLSIPRPSRCVCSSHANPHTRASEHVPGGTMLPALRVFLLASVVPPLPSCAYLHIEAAVASNVLLTSCCLWRAQEMDRKSMFNVAKIKNEFLLAPTTPLSAGLCRIFKKGARDEKMRRPDATRMST